MNHKQLGVSMPLMIVLLFFCAATLLIVLKLYPIYYDHWLINKVAVSFADEPDLADISIEEIESRFRKRLTVNGVRSFNMNNAVVNNDDGLLVIDIDYEVREHIISNIDAVVKFENHYESRF